MPIKINLLAEAQAEEDMRKRDPVKRAIFMGIFLVVLSLVWFSSILLVHVVASQKLNGVLVQIQSHTNDYAQVQVNLKKIADTQKRLDSLQLLSASRFLQGDLMNAFQHLYVPNVQLTRLRVGQSYALMAGAPSLTNSYGTVSPGHPPTSVERITFTLDAKDFSANPGDQVNHFKDALARQDYFNANLDKTNGIRLSNLSPPQSALDSKPYVLFTMECRFPDKSR
jgi:hypothetical protein